MNKITNYIDGHKTYIVAILTGLFATAGALGHPVPDYVYALLGAAGLGAVRSAITKNA